VTTSPCCHNGTSYCKKKKEKEKKGNNNNVMSTNYDISDFGFDGLGT